MTALKTLGNLHLYSISILNFGTNSNTQLHKNIITSIFKLEYCKCNIQQVKLRSMSAWDYVDKAHGNLFVSDLRLNYVYVHAKLLELCFILLQFRATS